jgi:hypothetical protein
VVPEDTEWRQQQQEEEVLMQAFYQSWHTKPALNNYCHQQQLQLQKFQKD